MMQKSYKVLVLGVDDRSALTVIRSLGRKGIVVHQGTDANDSVASYSKYVKRVIEFPKVGQEPDLWLQKLEKLLRSESYDLVIPTADNYLVQIVHNREKLEKLATLAIPDDRGFEYTYKKSKTLELAESLGVPIPKSFEVVDIKQLDAVCEVFRFPVIVKPVSSKVWQQNIRHALDVELAKDRSDLEKKLVRLLPICPVLIQSFHKGVGIGQEFLMDSGEMVAAFQHERVHEPLGGGGSSYRKSAPLDQELLKHSLNLLQNLRWTGVAMVEYKQDQETGESVLMEINGRFWGSLPLAIAAGVDFPGLLFDMLVKGKKPVENKYRYHLYARNPVKDLDWLKENIRADKKDPFKITVPMPKVIAEIRHIALLRERWDTIVLDDPKPGVRQLSKYFGENLRGVREKIQHKSLELNYRFNPFHRKNAENRFAKLVKRQPFIAFVCKGNICRSPFADYYLRAKLNGKADTIRIDSYGLIERVDRPSPDNAVEAAQDYGIDMRSHRSKLLTPKVVQQAGAVFIMDIELYRRVLLTFPESKNKLFFLGSFRKNAPSLEIIDPYGGDINRFQKIYRQISEAVENLLPITQK